MTDDVGDIASYYNHNTEQEHQRLERHRLEYDVTWRHFEKYLPPEGSILEIGAATGRYTVELARRGYTITAVDMSVALLNECMKNVAAEGLSERVQFVMADARDLSQVVLETFDVVLLMGPLYHLVLETDRKLALRQARERLRENGLIFSSFISRYGILGELMKKVPEWIENQAEVRSVMNMGRDPNDHPQGGFRGYFVKVDEAVAMHETAGFETLALAGVEPAISACDEIYNQLEGKPRELWLDLLYEVSTEPSIIGASRHLLYAGRKRGH